MEQSVTRKGRLEDTTCVVTGGSRGIGNEIATQLGNEGARVGVNYHTSPEAAAAVRDEIDDTPGTGEAMTVAGDVADPDSVEEMAAEVRDAFGSVDVLVNNAGINLDRRFSEMEPEDWEAVIDVNLNGAYYCTRAFYEDLLAAENGRVVNVASVVGQRGNFGQTNYAASKSGLIGFTRSLAKELAPHGATANCVAPGYTRTDMIETVPERVLDDVRDQIPMGRCAEPEEVAAAVRFLVEPDASYVTGEVVNVNGGL